MATSPGNRQAHERSGRMAETFAALLLRAKGYRVLETRHRSRIGELDIIARRRRLAVFVEVKLRRTLPDALQAITPASRRRIERAAEAWFVQRASTHGLDGMRYDIFALDRFFRFQHVRDAWRPDFALTGG